MKLTKTQLNMLLNQHLGTGYILIKTSDNNIRIADICVNSKGDWLMGLDHKPIAERLDDIARELSEILTISK